MDHRRLISTGALALTLCGVGSVLAASNDGAEPQAPTRAVAPPAPKPPFMPAPPLAAQPLPEAAAPAPERPARKRVKRPRSVVAAAPLPSPRAVEVVVEAPAPPAPEKALLPELAACLPDEAERTAEAAPVDPAHGLVEAWRVPLEGRALAAPILHGGCAVVVTDAGRVLAVDAGSGEVVTHAAAPATLMDAAGTDGLADAVADAAPLAPLVAGGVSAEEGAAADRQAAPRAVGQIGTVENVEGADAAIRAAVAAAVPALAEVALIVGGTVVAAPAEENVLVGLRSAPPAAAAPAPAVPAPAVPEVAVPVPAVPAPEAAVPAPPA